MNPLPIRAACAALAATLIATACAGGSADAPGEALVCDASDVPATFVRQSGGEFTARDLADRHPDPPQREDDLRDAGLTGGYFSYWVERVDRPPFDPPAEILCQALIFADSIGARAFVDGIAPAPEAFAATIMGLLPGETRTIQELPLAEPGLPPSSRAFRVIAADDLVDVTLYALISSNGRYVQSVVMGDAGGRTTVADALAVHRAVLGRTLVSR